MPPDYPRMRALVVDDNAFTRGLIQEVLHNLGFNLENLEEATDAADIQVQLRSRLCSRKIGYPRTDLHLRPADRIQDLFTEHVPAGSRNRVGIGFAGEPGTRTRACRRIVDDYPVNRESEFCQSTSAVQFLEIATQTPNFEDMIVAQVL